MLALSLKSISKTFVTTEVLRDVSFDVREGERVALIGRNGTGKTTILKIVSGTEVADSGNVIKKKELTVGYLHQIPEYSAEFTVNSVLHDAFSDLHKLRENLESFEQRLDSLSVKEMEEYGALQHQFEDRGGYDIERQVDMICHGLKIPELFRERSFNTLSGGEKTLVMLGKLLLQRPGLLMLDEPTNHLDIESVEWLEQFLIDYSGAVLIVSHDRYFLDHCINRVIELESGVIDNYKGNFSYYLKERDRRAEEQFKHYETQQKKIAAMKATILKYKDWSIGGDLSHFVRKAKSLQNLLDRVEEIDKPQAQQQKMVLKINTAARSGNDVVTVFGLEKAFNEKMLFNGTDLKINYHERIALLGKNGTGKSTFIKMLLKNEEPDSGEIKLGSNVRLAFLPQEIVFENENLSIFDTFVNAFPQNKVDAMGKLGRMLFSGETVEKQVSKLSGGEKIRLKLIMMLENKTNFLIMDEPTNHLDIDSREVIEEAINSFEGTVLFISHDRYFINRVASRIITVEDFKFVNYYGDYDYYREIKQQEKRDSIIFNDSSDKRFVEEKTLTKQAVDHEAMKAERRTRKRIERLENDIEQLQNQIDKKDEEIAVTGNDFSKAQALLQEKQKLEKNMEEIYEELFSLSD